MTELVTFLSKIGWVIYFASSHDQRGDNQFLFYMSISYMNFQFEDFLVSFFVSKTLSRNKIYGFDLPLLWSDKYFVIVVVVTLTFCELHFHRPRFTFKHILSKTTFTKCIRKQKNDACGN